MILDVIQFPDGRLREKSLPIGEAEVDETLRELARNMAETMYDEPGIGLAGASEHERAPRRRDEDRSDVHWNPPEG